MVATPSTIARQPPRPADVPCTVYGFGRRASWARMRAKMTLPADDERFRALLGSPDVGVGLTAPDGTVIAANPALCRLWGRTADEVIGHPAAEMVHPDDPMDPSQLGAFLASDQHVHHRARYLR